jgi:hypothetical protein
VYGAVWWGGGQAVWGRQDELPASPLEGGSCWRRGWRDVDSALVVQPGRVRWLRLSCDAALMGILDSLCGFCVSSFVVTAQNRKRNRETQEKAREAAAFDVQAFARVCASQISRPNPQSA